MTVCLWGELWWGVWKWSNFAVVCHVVIGYAFNIMLVVRVKHIYPTHIPEYGQARDWSIEHNGHFFVLFCAKITFALLSSSSPNWGIVVIFHSQIMFYVYAHNMEWWNMDIHATCVACGAKVVGVGSQKSTSLRCILQNWGWWVGLCSWR